ncbi:MBL fold metallo-hydrolase [Gloeocapsa sp. PCC 73106]|uniref:MBL fold metallo-hydrolase n=1 Tax=Gloeocapsa sp. PCC 73106 TaxID=102232 RepID=UPI0002AC2F71|nr:MBL fold metallo-hydrolase [Gloeocapsa sp. PCC 73106]ELR96458.1 putative Zn-dependent hydrolase of beta-lactamase fold [Gloeocapsa sp. PCC 73106]
MELTWLDSNSWLIGINGKQILLDPWLVGSLVFGNLPWLFKGDRTKTKPIPEQIDLILLSQGLEDHAHPPTLEHLDHNIPVVTSPNGAKVVTKIGYSQIHSLNHGEVFNLEDKLEIRALPGSPIGPTLVENAYLLKDLSTGQTLYYEPHGYHSPLIKEYAPVDIVVTPIIDLKLPLLGSVIKGQSKALEVCQWLKPQVIIPTAAGGDIQFAGLIMSLLKTEGSAEQLQQRLGENQLPTQVIEALPGEKLTLLATV